MNKKIELIRSIFLSNFKRLDSPYKVTFALTYKCNLHCKICRIYESPSREEMGVREIEKLFKNLRYLSWLDLTGGEVTLREDLIEIARVIIKNAKKLSILHVSTNGQLPSRILELTKEFLKAGIILIVNISIEAPSLLNDELRGFKGAYQNSLETFKLLKTLHKGRYYLSCTLSDYNIDYIDELILGLKKDIPSFSFSDLHFNIFYNSFHYFRNQDINAFYFSNKERIKKYLLLCKKGGFIKQFLESRYIQIFTKSSKENRSSLKCQALRSMCFVDPYGEVYPCTANSRSIGNLRGYDYDLQKMWNEPHVLQNWKEIEYYRCATCWGACEVYPLILGNLGKNG